MEKIAITGSKKVLSIRIEIIFKHQHRYPEVTELLKNYLIFFLQLENIALYRVVCGARVLEAQKRCSF